MRFFTTQVSDDSEKILPGYFIVVSIEDREELDRAIQVTNDFLEEFPDDLCFQSRLERLQEAKASSD